MPSITERTEAEYIQTVLERIKRKTVYDGDCWRYTGGKTGVDGHGRITYRATKVTLNRFIAYAYHGLTLDTTLTHQVACHKLECRFKDCWNPDHIYVGWPKDNVADQIKAGTFRHAALRHGPNSFNYDEWLAKRNETN